MTPMTDDNHLRTVGFTPYYGYPKFKLSLWDTNGRDSMGKHRLAYCLSIKRRRGLTRWEPIFLAEDFHCSPMHAIDSDETVKSLMSFLTLRPGDTDREYFKDYTPAQRAYCSEHAESLAAEVDRRFSKED
jgi:hypothetical protein